DTAPGGERGGDACMAGVGVRHPAPRVCRTGKGPRAVVLRAAVDPVRRSIVYRDVVELPDRQIVAIVPRPTAVVAQIHATVVAEHEVIGLRGVDPERVM